MYIQIEMNYVYKMFFVDTIQAHCSVQYCAQFPQWKYITTSSNYYFVVCYNYVLTQVKFLWYCKIKKKMIWKVI